MTGFAIDVVVTVSTIVKFNRRLKVMDDIAAKIKVLSNQIGENIYENVEEALEKSAEFKEEHAEKIEKLENLRHKYDELLSKKNAVSSRLMKAFPDMKSKQDVYKRQVSRLIEGEYFKIEQMLSSDYETKVKINKRELLDCIDRATLLVKEGDKKPIIMNITDDKMELKINSFIGSMNEEIDITKDGKDILIGRCV